MSTTMTPTRRAHIQTLLTQAQGLVALLEQALQRTPTPPTPTGGRASAPTATPAPRPTTPPPPIQRESLSPTPDHDATLRWHGVHPLTLPKAATADARAESVLLEARLAGLDDSSRMALCQAAIQSLYATARRS